MTTDSDSTVVGLEYGEAEWPESVAVSEAGDPPPLDRPWLLLSPLATGGVYLGLVLVAGSEVLHTGRPWPHGVIAGALLTAFFGVCLAGTLRLYDDAVALRRVEADWQPNPWHYVLGGALVLTGYRALRITVLGGTATRPALYLAGSFVVATVLSSLVAGPLYLFLRRRRLPES